MAAAVNVSAPREMAIRHGRSLRARGLLCSRCQESALPPAMVIQLERTLSPKLLIYSRYRPALGLVRHPEKRPASATRQVVEHLTVVPRCVQLVLGGFVGWRRSR